MTIQKLLENYYRLQQTMLETLGWEFEFDEYDGYIDNIYYSDDKNNIFFTLVANGDVLSGDFTDKLKGYSNKDVDLYKISERQALEFITNFNEFINTRTHE